MTQDVVDSVGIAVSSLSAKKKKGEKVGRIGFRKYCNMIPLRQYGVTYRIDFEKNMISIQRLSKPIKVRGLSQIPKDAEIANAKLVRKPDGFYFHITTYSVKEERIPTGIVGACDFGIAKNFTFDNGETVDICVPETAKLKRDQRKMNRLYVKNGKTKNHEKRVLAIRRGYQKIENRKNDKANKLVHDIKKSYDLFAIQDEMISSWHRGLFGKNVQHSAMGRVKARLKNSPHTIVVPRSFPSTKRCPLCGNDTPHPLSKRDYDCGHCGFHHESRDGKSAAVILKEALKQHVCTERTTKGSAKAAVSTVGFGATLFPPQTATDQWILVLPLGKQEAQVFRLG
jgi:putative transposase